MSDRPHDDALLALLYDELPPGEAEALRRTLAAESPESLERLAEWQAIREVVAELPELEPDPQMHYDIIREARRAVDTEAKPSRLWAWLEQLTLMPALAGLLLVVLAAGLTVRLSTDMEGAEQGLDLQPQASEAPAPAALNTDSPTPGAAVQSKAAATPAEEPVEDERPAFDDGRAEEAKPAQPDRAGGEYGAGAYGEPPKAPTGGAEAPPQVQSEVALTDKAGVIDRLDPAPFGDDELAEKKGAGKKRSAEPEKVVEVASKRSARPSKKAPPKTKAKARRSRNAKLEMGDLFAESEREAAPAPKPEPAPRPAEVPPPTAMQWDSAAPDAKDLAEATAEGDARGADVATLDGAAAGPRDRRGGDDLDAPVAQAATRGNGYAPPPPPATATATADGPEAPFPAAPADVVAVEAEAREEKVLDEAVAPPADDDVADAPVAGRAAADEEQRAAPTDSLSRARAHKAAGRYREAVGEFEAFLASNADGDGLDRVWFETAETYRALGQAQQALRFYRLVAGTESPYAGRARARIDALEGQPAGRKAAGQAAPPARARPQAAPEAEDALESVRE